MEERHLGRRVLPLVVLLGLVVTALDGNAEAKVVGPDPVTCRGYPEKRVYLENQSWVEPQLGRATHPGTGKQGHMHVATCFPLHQRVTSPTLSLDVRVQLHNVPGQPLKFISRTYGMGAGSNGHAVVTLLDRGPNKWSCSSTDCEKWFHVDFPLSEVSESGWTGFHLLLYVQQADGDLWYNVNRWYFEVANGKPPRPDPPTNIRIGGDTSLTADAPGQTNYSEARITTPDFPWNFSTGQMIPVSGIWRPDVWFRHMGHATIDPSLHANPPNHGTVVFHGMGGAGTQGNKQLTIDTTQLSNGPHKLLLVSCDERASGTDNCGVLAVPFTVSN